MPDRRSNMPRLPLSAGLAPLLLASLLAGPVLAEPLYAVRDGARVIITNTPSHADARPLDGKAQPVPGRVRPGPFDRLIARAAAENGLSPSLVRAVAHVESAMNPRALSPKGAQGLMQLMPATAKHYGVDDPYDPWQNLRGGTRHLRHLLDEFGGDLTLALAAYNAGATAVRRAQGVPNYPETQGYVRKVHARLGGRPPILAARPARPAASAGAIRGVRGADGRVVFQN